MVRYLKKPDPAKQQPKAIEPIAPSVTPLPAHVQETGQHPASDDGQIKNLAEHIRVLEEKLKLIEQRLKAKDDQVAQIGREKDNLERMLKAMREVVTPQVSSIAVPHVQPVTRSIEKPIESKSQEKNKSPFDWQAVLTWLKIGALGGLILLGIVLAGKIGWQVSHPPYSASMVLRFSPVDFKSVQISTQINPDYEVRVVQTAALRARVMAQTLNWPAFITRQSWLMYPVSLCYARLYEAHLGKPKGTIVIKTWAQAKDTARARLLAIEKAYRENYAKRRKNMLMHEQQQLVASTKVLMSTMDVRLKEMATVPLNERFWGVSKSIRTKIDAVVVNRALDLEKEMALVKNQYKALQVSVDQARQAGRMDFMDKQDRLQLAYFEALRLRLKSMELKRWLIPEGALSSYEEGVKDIKRRIATCLNDWAQQASLNDGQESLAIKWAFVSARYEALNVILNRWYLTSDELTGKSAVYHRLANDVDKALVALEDANRLKAAINEFLSGDLDKEVTIETPVTIVKK